MGWFSRLLRRIAAANQDQYGRGVPSCCQCEGKDPSTTGGRVNTGPRPERK